MPEGWKVWLDWARANDFSSWYIDILERDAGRYLGYQRVVSKRTEVGLEDHAWPSTLRHRENHYARPPLLRSSDAPPVRTKTFLHCGQRTCVPARDSGARSDFPHLEQLTSIGTITSGHHRLLPKGRHLHESIFNFNRPFGWLEDDRRRKAPVLTFFQRVARVGHV